MVKSVKWDTPQRNKTLSCRLTKFLHSCRLWFGLYHPRCNLMTQSYRFKKLACFGDTCCLDGCDSLQVLVSALFHSWDYGVKLM